MNPAEVLPPVDPTLLSRILDACTDAPCYEVVLQLLCAAGVVFEYAVFDHKASGGRRASVLEAKLLASAFQFAAERAAKLVRQRQAEEPAEDGDA